MGLPSRTDRRDGMALQAALSELSIEFIDGVAGENISEKAIPVGKDLKHLTGGELGCWRGHINALQEYVCSATRVPNQHVANRMIGSSAETFPLPWSSKTTPTGTSASAPS